MRDSVWYAYSDTTGALVSVTSLLGTVTRFAWDVAGALVRTTRPGGIVDSTAYDSLARVILAQVTNGSMSAYKDPDYLLRRDTLQYAVDPARPSAVLNSHGWKDTVQASYAGLGALTSLGYNRPANLTDSAFYVPVGGDVAGQSFTLDPLGNTYAGTVGTAGQIGFGDRFSQHSSIRSYYHPGTARQDSTFDGGDGHGVVYDAAGNTVFFYQASAAGLAVNDRASWYGAEGQLRVAEWRQATTDLTGDWRHPGWTDVFEEYRYDALGRRVLVMSRQGCATVADSTSLADCRVSRVRRTVWEGPRELWEIQMPAGAADSLRVENDTAVVVVPTGGTSLSTYSDPNPLFGRVAYTYTGGVDAPLVVTRFQLVRRKSATDTALWPPVELQPNWNWRGEADLGTFADGGMKTCTDASHCVFVQWRGVAFATGLASELLWTQPRGYSPYGWFGTLLTNKEDGTGTLYRRARSVDPMTGRFTQEDPVGLAGGLNLYGYANGDAVSYSDPFGLCPIEFDGVPCAFTGLLAGGAAGFTYGLAAGAVTAVGSGGVLIPVAGAEVVGATLTGALAGSVIGAGRDLISGLQILLNKSEGETKGAPKPSPNFQPPTNSPRDPPTELPEGHTVRVMGPTQQYPNGYWRQYNGQGQPVDPSTGKPPSNVTKPEFQARTHVPRPPR